MRIATAPAEKGPAPRLIGTRCPDEPEGVVLVLHGGAGRSGMPVSPTQLSVLRMVPIAQRVARAGRRRLAVLRLLNAVRGYGSDPLSNVRWALGEVGARYPGVPVGLVGHSLGGSVALAATGDDRVHASVALAPWLSGTESPRHLGGTATLIVHGDKDRVTSCAASRQYAERARRHGERVSFVEVSGGEHTMLRRMLVFDLLAARFLAQALERDPASGHLLPEVQELATAAHRSPHSFTI